MTTEAAYIRLQKKHDDFAAAAHKRNVQFNAMLAFIRQLPYLGPDEQEDGRLEIIDMIDGATVSPHASDANPERGHVDCAECSAYLRS